MPTPEQPFIVAHRAGNEPASLARACKLGVDLIEADVRYHRGRIEVRHLKSMGPVPLLWDRWLLAPGWTPRFLIDDLTALAPPDCELMIDIKPGHVDYPRQVLDALRAGIPGRPYTVCSQSWKLLEAFHDEPGVRVVHSIGSARMLRDVMPHLARHSSDAVSIHKKLLDERSVPALLKVVDLIMTWPVNTESELHRLQALGVNGFIIDDFALMEHMLAERKATPSPVDADGHRPGAAST